MMNNLKVKQVSYSWGGYHAQTGQPLYATLTVGEELLDEDMKTGKMGKMICTSIELTDPDEMYYGFKAYFDNGDVWVRRPGKTGVFDIKYFQKEKEGE